MKLSTAIGSSLIFGAFACGAPKPVQAPTPDPCGGARIELADALSQAACEVPVAKRRPEVQHADEALVVQVRASQAKVKPGGHVNLDVTFVNKGNASLPLTFMVDPLPHFEIEVYDARGRRVDVPKGAPPKLPRGSIQRAEAGAAQITLDGKGEGHLALGWDANRLRWAPEKAKGAPIGADYPRVSAGPLPKGKYTLRVVSSLNGATTSSMPVTVIDVSR